MTKHSCIFKVVKNSSVERHTYFIKYTNLTNWSDSSPIWFSILSSDMDFKFDSALFGVVCATEAGIFSCAGLIP